jgi:hypothetical protein
MWRVVRNCVEQTSDLHTLSDDVADAVDDLKRFLISIRLLLVNLYEKQSDLENVVASIKFNIVLRASQTYSRNPMLPLSSSMIRIKLAYKKLHYSFYTPCFQGRFLRKDI